MFSSTRPNRTLRNNYSLAKLNYTCEVHEVKGMRKGEQRSGDSSQLRRLSPRPENSINSAALRSKVQPDRVLQLATLIGLIGGAAK